MDLKEYQGKAARTMNAELDGHQTRDHALCGLMSEIGEVASCYQHALQGAVLVRERLFEEIGDVLWFIAELCTVERFDLGEIAAANIAKLEKRYPEGFSVERSERRHEVDTE